MKWVLVTVAALTALALLEAAVLPRLTQGRPTQLSPSWEPHYVVRR